MPKDFIFKVNGHQTFKKRLYTGRCEGITRAGQRCKRKCIIGFEYCPVHLQMVEHLKIKDSNIHGAGKGLFVSDKTQAPNAIVFRNNDPIAPYHGEVINRDQLEHRYGEYTAPYAVGVTHDWMIDSAAKRGVASIANMNPNHNNATLVAGMRNHQPFARIKATRNIRNNQEIYLSYGNEYIIDSDPPINYVTKNVRG